MSLAWNIMTTLSSRVLMVAFALVSSIVLARILGPEGRGVFAVVLLLPELAANFGLLGFDQANGVYAGLDQKAPRCLVWQSAVMAVVVGGVIAVGIGAFLGLRLPGSQSLIHGPLWLYLLALSTVPFRMVGQYWGAILRGMNRILLINTGEVSTKIASVALVLVFVAWLKLDVAGAVWADYALNMGTAILMVGLLMYVGAWGRPTFDWSLWKRTKRFALPAYCSTILSWLNYRVDQLILAVMLPPEQLGFYVIAVGIAERMWLPTGAVATALLPHLTHSREHDPALAAAISRHVMIWTGGACLLVFVLADVAVRFMYSSAFAAAVAPLRWLLPGIFTLSAAKVLVAEMLAREKIDFTVWVSAVAALVNIVGNLVLVPRMGISGAALASSISYSLLSFIVTWYYLRETGVPWTALLPCRNDLLAYAALWGRKSSSVSQNQLAGK